MLQKILSHFLYTVRESSDIDIKQILDIVHLSSRCHNQMHLIDNHQLFKDGQVFHSRNYPLRGNSCTYYVLFYKDHCKSYHFGSILNLPI